MHDLLYSSLHGPGVMDKVAGLADDALESLGLVSSLRPPMYEGTREPQINHPLGGASGLASCFDIVDLCSDWCFLCSACMLGD